MTKTQFRTAPIPTPTRAQFRGNRSGCTFEQYVANTHAMNERVAAYEIEQEECARKIRVMLPATEGQLTFGLRHDHDADLVCRTLHAMVGKRFGAETSGEVVIAGYSAGGEVYGLR